jgi:hypothetical protein
MKSSGRFWLPLIIGLGVVLAGVSLYVLNGKITEMIAGEKFRSLLDKETSKGLKFEAHYAPLSRVGLLGMHCDTFHGDKGKKAIVSIDADDIYGWFNPGGVALRHWELHDLRIKRGTVKIQKTNPTPGAPKGATPIPWWALFWPYRVELEDVKCFDADVLFQLQNKESGIYHTLLEITPNGRDFEYDGKGGYFQIPISPKLALEHVHLLIRKPRLYCRVFDMSDGSGEASHRIHITGDAGLQDDKTIHATAEIQSMEVAPWFPEKLRDHVAGEASGKVEYHSTGTGLETATAQGALSVAGAVLRSLPIVQEYVKLTKCPDPGDLHLEVCRVEVKVENGAMTLSNLEVECKGVFKLTGTVTLAKDKTLSGELHLGMTDPYIQWLPTAKTALFTQEDGDYHVATIHVSGTAKKPVQDLSPRVEKELEKSPLTAVKLFFNAV